MQKGRVYVAVGDLFEGTYTVSVLYTARGTKLPWQNNNKHNLLLYRLCSVNVCLSWKIGFKNARRRKRDTHFRVNLNEV